MKPALFMKGHISQLVSSGHLRMIFPACPGEGFANGICVVTSRSLSRVFLLKPVIKLESNRCCVWGDLPRRYQLSLSIF